MTFDREGAWPARFGGVIAAPSTPFRDDGRVDSGRIAAYADFLLARGVAALMVGGTTGEFVAMEVEERAAAASAFLAAASRRVPVIVHVGHVDLRSARRLADAAAAAGADGLTAITPYLHRTSPGAVEHYLRTLARTVPEIPFFFYNYPEASANRVPPSSFMALLEEPNVCGVKLSVGTWEEIEPYLALPPDLLVTSGNDGLMERFAGAGGRAIVSGNAAAVPDVVVALFGAFVRGEGTAAHRDALDRLVRLTRAGSVDRLKQLLRLRGMDVGPARVRTFTAGEEDPEADTAAALDLLVRDHGVVAPDGAGTPSAGTPSTGT